MSKIDDITMEQRMLEYQKKLDNDKNMTEFQRKEMLRQMIKNNVH